MTKFSDTIFAGGLPQATTPLALMLQTVTSSFTLLTRQASKSSNKFCSGGQRHHNEASDNDKGVSGNRQPGTDGSGVNGWLGCTSSIV